MEKLVIKRVFLRLLCLAVTMAWGGAVWAAWLDNVPVTVVQPNGDTLHLFATGDEFYHYVHDVNGYTILQHPVTGCYVYAEKLNDRLVASNYVYGTINPSEKGIRPRFTISDEEYMQRRREWDRFHTYNVSANRSPNTNSDYINHIVIFISFVEDSVITKNFNDVDYMFNSTTTGARSVYNYFKTVSYDKIHLVSSYYPTPEGSQIVSYVCPIPKAYFKPHSLFNLLGYQNDSVRREREIQLLNDAIAYVNSNYPIPNSLNIDYNHDEIVDIITFAVNSDVDGWGDLFWPHKWEFDEDTPVRINGKKPYLYTFELIKSEHFYLNTFCHELTHVFGAPDFYHSKGMVDYPDNPNPLGRWDIMCSTNDDGFTGQKISNTSAYIKWKYLNWIEEIPTITEPGVYTLQTLGSHSTQNAYRIASSDPDQYYILEYRDNTELFDENTYGKGLVIYRVNEESKDYNGDGKEDYQGNLDAYPAQGMYDELYVFRPGGTLTNNGQLNQAFFSSESGRVKYNQSTNPSPCLSDGTPDVSISICDVFAAGNTISFSYGYKVEVLSNNGQGGTVTGGGLFAYNMPCTITATPNPGYYFNGWMENGVVVNTQPNYTFTITSDRNLTAVFSTTVPQVFDGNVVANSDGSRGVVFYTNPMGTGGTMVALEDASEGCPWGDKSDIIAMQNYLYGYSCNVLNDMNGYANTEAMLNHQGEGTGYAADVVDFEHGWYLPSANQLRKLYGALPLIEEIIAEEGGTLMTEDSYWSSTESSLLDAWDPMFGIGTAGKTSNHRVRAVRDFSNDGNFIVTLEPSDMNGGFTTGGGLFADGSQVTVEAEANTGYVFGCWKEDGIEVSKEATYTFTVYSNRHLVADFLPKSTIGIVVTNPDGSKGVVFYTNPSGSGGTMVALEDASEGCLWGDKSDIIAMQNYLYGYSCNVLNDKNGYANTEAMLNHQGEGTGYAADVVDFEHGWYLPSANQLRKLYGALPFIEEAIETEGGTLMTEDSYWSSTESLLLDAWDPMFGIGTAGKTSNHRVRAVRDFSNDGNFIVIVAPSDVSSGSVDGAGVYALGNMVTVTAEPVSGYVFRSWMENGVEVSYDATYTFTVYSNRDLVANFVPYGSIGTVITNLDGSRGVVFYQDPSGVGGWMVALDDASDACRWGNSGEDVLPLWNFNPNQSVELLSELDGIRNSRILRGWYMNNPRYAAGQMDYSNQWYLPSAGQLRKLYAALPYIETPIINAGGTSLTDDAYWSSTERSENEAWTPSFAFSSSNKGGNRRVRAIRNFYTTGIQNAHIFVGTNGMVWSDPSNWINPSLNLRSSDDDVIIATQCVVDIDASVRSLTMTYGSTISVDEGKTLAATESISNTYNSRINLGNGSQLVNPTEGTYFSMSKEIAGYGDSEDGGWYTIATPLKNGMSVTPLATGSYDLYYYSEPTYYWINQKDGNNNFTLLENGHGYLYSNEANQTLEFTGQAKSSISEYSMSFINTLASSPINGFNLLGNPFTCNLDINNVKINGATLSSYYKISNGNAWMAYTDADDEPIHPAEGFLVKGDAGTVSFNAASRMDVVNGYVRLVLYEGEQKQDRAYLRITEGEGLPKMRMDDAEAELYFREGSEDFAIAESRVDMTEYPLCFKAKHNGTYIIVADLLNTECDYLRLIDGFTGDDIDLLATPTYTFEAKATDDPSRFKLMFRTSSSYK